MKKVLILISLMLCILLVSAPAFGDGSKKSKGQTVYAAMNHNCYNPYWPPSGIDPGLCTWSVNTRLSIRNVDFKHPITVTEINIHDPDGIFMLNFLDFYGGPVDIAPLASATFAAAGGPPNAPDYWSAVFAGHPSFIVKWIAKRAVHPPIIASSHVIMNRDPDWGPNPQKIEGLTVTSGVVLRNNRRDD